MDKIASFFVSIVIFLQSILGVASNTAIDKSVSKGSVSTNITSITTQNATGMRNKKEVDIKVRNITSEVFNAFNRVKVTKGSLPLKTDLNAVPLSNEPVNSSLDWLISSGELHPEFRNKTEPNNLSKIYLTYKKEASFFSVCFLPESDYMQTDKSTKYDRSGNLKSNCLSENHSGDECYWCMR